MHRVAVLAANYVKSLELAIPGQVFGTAHSRDRPAGAVFGEPLYEVVICGERPDQVVVGRSAAEMYRMTALHDLAAVLRADTVVVPGISTSVAAPAEVLEILREAKRGGARIASICCGAFILAAAGLLDGRRATTHWSNTALLAERFPEVEVDPDVLFVDEGDVLTSAGAATGLDLCVHMVRNDFGAAVAADTARQIVIAPQRAGGQAQFIPQQEPAGEPAALQSTLAWMQQHLAEPLTLTDIARHAVLSGRTLSRRFHEQTGTSPLQWLLVQRVRRARELLETSALPVEEIARQCGFGTAINLRKHFTRRIGVSPQDYRRAFQPRTSG